jgi:hypothetical protein
MNQNTNSRYTKRQLRAERYAEVFIIGILVFWVIVLVI